MSGRDEIAMIGGVMVLERAMSYTLGSLALVTPATLTRATPCAEWDVRALLRHMADSLAVLGEAAEVGRVSPTSGSRAAAAELVDAVRERACALLAAWAGAERPFTIAVGGRLLPGPVVAGAGAIEVAVHGWDLAAGCGRPRTMPASLAEELLDLAAVFVMDADREGRFAAPAPVDPSAGPTDRLVGYLGRDPGSVA